MTMIGDVAERCEQIIAEVERAVVGKREPLELVLLGFLADGHVLIEDFPGLAKTLIARSFAQAFDMGFARIQFTPDLMPSDVTGSSVYNQRTAEDPGSAARGDAGAAGHDRRPDEHAGTALPRRRDAEPDRVRGDLSAAG